LKEIFKSLDTTGKGQLTRAVFTEKLIELYGENDGKYYADKIFSNLDLDGSGQISYDEFLSSMISSKKIVTDERLEKAFKMFDKDNSGKLSVHEIISVFGGDEDSWKKVIEQIDLNEDGEVDFNEFKLMMLNVDKNVGIKKNIKSKRTITKPENID
jgi:calcium-dependent protein kinase